MPIVDQSEHATKSFPANMHLVNITIASHAMYILPQCIQHNNGYFHALPKRHSQIRVLAGNRITGENSTNPALDSRALMDGRPIVTTQTYFSRKSEHSQRLSSFHLTLIVSFSLWWTLHQTKAERKGIAE